MTLPKDAPQRDSHNARLLFLRDRVNANDHTDTEMLRDVLYELIEIVKEMA